MTYWPGPVGGTVVIMANSGRLAHLVAWGCDVWVRRRWDLCAVVCWQLLLAQFGVGCFVARALVVALFRDRGGRSWWQRLAAVDVVELALDAAGLPGALLAQWAVLVVWLHRKAAPRRRAGLRGGTTWHGGVVPRGGATGAT
ncbi:hypothetical protein ABZ816_03205 [Actinosynnema sp. NPDC047251]|uniref:hypothetical protein n=1 Tax=Saccharothrix espanaensis TaxID=103731 RepID=UPI00059C9733|nr:hypothetical protein [Saccharothrix espanaensis]